MLIIMYHLLKVIQNQIKYQKVLHILQIIILQD